VYVSHAAVGQQMKRLEEQLQVDLFDRSQKSPQLNALGKAFIPKAREVVAAYDTMLDDIVGTAQLHGELIIGAVPSVIRELIPRSIKKLIETYPELHIRVVPGLSEDLHEQLERGAIDASVIAMPTHVGAHMEWRPFTEEELVLLTAPEVSESDPVKLMQTMPYISQTRRASVSQLAEDWLLKNNISVRPSMEMESLETLSSMISHNLGVSIAPNLCVPDPIFKSLRKIPLDFEKNDHSAGRILGILARKNSSKSTLIDKLLETIENIVLAEKSNS
jgi:DNA-binding transcriptional LysR family regulator